MATLSNYLTFTKKSRYQFGSKGCFLVVQNSEEAYLWAFYVRIEICKIEAITLGEAPVTARFNWATALLIQVLLLEPHRRCGIARGHGP